MVEMGHSTFQITFHQGTYDLAGKPTEAVPVRYPVTAVYRHSDSLSASLRVGEFILDRKELDRSGDVDVRGYGLVLGKTLFQGAIYCLFREALAAAADHDSLHVLLQLESPSLRDLSWERLYGPLDGDEGWEFLGKSRSEEHTSELQSLRHLVCRLLLE